MKALLFIFLLSLTTNAAQQSSTVKATNGLELKVLYNIEYGREEFPYVYAENLKVELSGDKIVQGDEVEVVFDTYSWNEENNLHFEHRSIMRCEKKFCYGDLHPHSTILVNNNCNVRHEAQVIFNGEFLMNPFPTIHNPSGERFHMILPSTY
jgi:hypothetical protein